MEPMIRKIEKNILNNLTIFSIVLILIFSALQIWFFLAWKNFLEIKDFITLIWAIFVFWYWYKTYERNKELEILDKYGEKYNQIKEEVNVTIIKLNENNDEKNEIILKNELKQNYTALINLFYEEFYLRAKWYISDDLWNEWKNWIILDINDLFFKFFIWSKVNMLFADIYWNYLQYDSLHNIKINWQNFLDFIDEIILKIESDIITELSNKTMKYSKEEYSKFENKLRWIQNFKEVSKNHRDKIKTLPSYLTP